MNSRQLISNLFLCLLFSCSNQKSFNSDRKLSDDSQVDEGVIVEKFYPSSNPQERPVDMIWMVDNSGSMWDEIEHVRKNFDRFIKKTSEFSDLKVTLVSSSHSHEYALPMQLSNKALGQGHSQLNEVVGSYNILMILAMGLCEKSATDLRPNTVLRKQAEGRDSNIEICGQNMTIPFFESSGLSEEVFYQLEYTRSIEGKIKRQFREEAKKIVVIVSDDNSWSIDDKNFLSVINGSLNTDLTFFAFTGINNSPCAEEDGKAYTALADKTNGAVFDICEPNWESHFDELIDNVEKLVQNSFDLNAKDIEIVSVEVDGTLLNKDSYRITGSAVTIDSEELSDDTGEVIIKYKGERQ